jgi:hypothetical protein
MAKTTTMLPHLETEQDPIALFEAAVERIAEATKDMTEEEREELAELLTNEVKRGIRERIERGEPV